MMLSRFFKTKFKLITGIAIGAGAGLFAAFLWHAGWLNSFELKTWDWRVRLMAEPGVYTDRIRLILLDQNSLDWGAEQGLSWPWPREVYAPIVNYCKRQGARSLVFDVLFTEPSAYGVEDDLTLAEAVRENGNFASAIFLGGETGKSTAWEDFAPSAFPLASFLNETDKLPENLTQLRASFPIPELAQAASVLAAVNANPDRDGIYRRLPLCQVFDDRVLLSLGLGAWQAENLIQDLQYQDNALVIDAKKIPLDGKGEALLRYRGPSRTHQAYSAAAVIESELLAEAGGEGSLPADSLRDCFVFFGYSAPGLLDLRPTPVSGVYPGVEIHATVLDNFLSNDFLQDFPRVWSFGLLFFFAICAGTLVCYGRTANYTFIAFLFVLSLPVLLSLWVYKLGYWLPLLPLESAGVLAWTGGMLFNYATEGRQKRFIRSVFKQYLSEDVIARLVADPKRLTLGGEQKTLSIFFSDLRGFTGISEKLTPQDLTSLLNKYLSAMTDIIQAEKGTLDKYQGDAIIAFWNAPLEQPDHARRAVRAALLCQARLDDMRESLAREYGVELFMRIGVNTGVVVVGNMGSYSRFNYTILGDAANLASRLEGANKQLGTSVLISDATREELLRSSAAEIVTRGVGEIMVVGRGKPVAVFEPLFAGEYEGRREGWEEFARALAEFKAGEFEAARRSFARLRERDAVAAVYEGLCGRFLEAPPGAQWGGVIEMSEK